MPELLTGVINHRTFPGSRKTRFFPSVTHLAVLRAFSERADAATTGERQMQRKSTPRLQGQLGDRPTR